MRFLRVAASSNKALKRRSASGRILPDDVHKAGSHARSPVADPREHHNLLYVALLISLLCRLNLLEMINLSILVIIGHKGTPVRTISATEAKQRFAAMLDAAQREPVEIRRQDRPAAVLISPEEYDRLRGLAVSEFQRFCDQVGKKAVARGLTEKKLAAILATDA